MTPTITPAMPLHPHTGPKVVLCLFTIWPKGSDPLEGKSRSPLLDLLLVDGSGASTGGVQMEAASL